MSLPHQLALLRRANAPVGDMTVDSRRNEDRSDEVEDWHYFMFLQEE